jgi:hypothetical protein
MRRAIVAAIVISSLGGSAFAADPALSRILPRGATRGTETELTLTGLRLDDAEEILFYEPGIAVKELKAVDAKTVKAKVAIAPDAHLGEYTFRLRTDTGISPLRTFFVGSLPSIDEKEPNNDASHPQKLDKLNVTVAGVIENEGIDCFVVEAKKGQRLSVEVEGMRLGNPTLLDPAVTILDEKGSEIAGNDDSTLFVQDPFVSILAPRDGQYVIRLRDSAYAGGGDAYYRMHVGTFPRPTAVYPAGGKANEELKVKLIGDPSGTFEQTIKLPAEPTERFGIVAEHNGEHAPSANPMRVSAFANLLENEPNDSADTATSAPGELPIAFNGVIEKPADADYFKFAAKKGQSFSVNCFARRLRSPLDPVISIDRNKRTLAGNDDSGGPDSQLRFTAPDDGEYTLHVRDNLRRGGPDFVYRVEVTPAEPSVTLALPQFDQNNSSQERSAIVVPRGNRFATLVRLNRTDFNENVTLSADGLPDGITMRCEPVPGGENVVPVVFEAKSDAPVAGKFFDLVAKPAKSDLKLRSRFEQQANLVPNGNDPSFYVAHVDKLAASAAEEAPFKIELVQPKVPLVQGGSMQLKVVTTRKAGFSDPIRLQMVFNPPGVSAGNVEIDSGRSETTIPLNAEDGAAARKWKICVLGASAGPDGGRTFASTQLGDLEISQPLLAMIITQTNVQQGKTGKIVVNVETKTPFDGKAKARLVGLPPNVSTSPEELEFSASDKTLTFNVSANDRAPVGLHRSLLCVATITKDGEPLVHNLARGGMLRIDSATANKPNPKVAARVK